MIAKIIPTTEELWGYENYLSEMKSNEAFFLLRKEKQIYKGFNNGQKKDIWKILSLGGSIGYIIVFEDCIEKL